MITVAAGFPTTVNPILQNGLVPVFVDVELPTYNIDVDALEAGHHAAHPGHHDRAHAGQSVRPERSSRIVGEARPVAGRGLLRRAGLHLSRAAMVGTFGDVGTLSFYPAHHITMGEGGAVFTDDPI